MVYLLCFIILFSDHVGYVLRRGTLVKSDRQASKMLVSQEVGFEYSKELMKRYHGRPRPDLAHGFFNGYETLYPSAAGPSYDYISSGTMNLSSPADEVVLADIDPSVCIRQLYRAAGGRGTALSCWGTH